MKKNEEYQLQKQVCAYLNNQYPNVMYYSTGIGLQLTMLQGVRNKAIQKEGFHCPDLLILEPKNGMAGLFLELKAKTIYKKNGELLKNEHVENQLKTIELLEKKGYASCFAIGFSEAKILIDNYLKK
jgi:hypothetical protein